MTEQAFADQVPIQVTYTETGHSRYACPYERCEYASSNGLGRLREHLKTEHPDFRSEIVGAGRKQHLGRPPLLPEGEPITIGEPQERVEIILRTTRARRRIIVHQVGLADAVDCVAGALRQQLQITRGGRAR